MKCMWLSQAGLLLTAGDTKIMIDPYLSNSVIKLNPANYRRTEVDPKAFDIKPDIMIFTHNHLDHYDPETVEKFITKDTAVTVLAPTSVWNEVRSIGGRNNYVSFNRHTVWSEKGVRIEAVKAEHSDPAAIGVIVSAEGKNLYITGDTLYNTEVLGDITAEIDTVFLPINGVGNNMNMLDAAVFAEKTGAKTVVPLHYGLFDELNPTDFKVENKRILKLFEEEEI